MSSQTSAPEPSQLLLTGTVDITAAKPKDGEAPSRPKVAIAAYSGAVMQVAQFYSPIILELSGIKASRQKMPLLRDHDPSRIVGMSDKVEIDAAGVRISGLVTGENADAVEVVSQSKNGFEWQASIGAMIIRREFLEAGKKAQVNGREVSGPLLIARESLLTETSFVAIGADQQTSASVAAKQAPPAAPPPVTLTAAGNGAGLWIEAGGTPRFVPLAELKQLLPAL